MSLLHRGAEYYAQLQELYVEKGELLAEYKVFKANEDWYQLQTFLLGFVFCRTIYFLFIEKEKI